MYSEIKDITEFLEIVNACVSHELRNPLNSICALNLLKKILYQKLRVILDSLKKGEFNNDDLIEFENIL